MTYSEISFFRSILNDGYDKVIVEAILATGLSSSDAFDHLLVGDLKLFTRIEKSGHHCSFGVSVDDSSCT